MVETTNSDCTGSPIQVMTTLSVRMKIGITFIFRFHRRPIQLVKSPGRQKKTRRKCRKNDKKSTGRTQLIEWDDGETCG